MDCNLTVWLHIFAALFLASLASTRALADSNGALVNVETEDEDGMHFIAVVIDMLE